MKTVLVCGASTRGEIRAGLRTPLRIESVIYPRIPIRENVVISFGNDHSTMTDLAVRAILDEPATQHVPFYKRFTKRRRRFK